MEKNKRQIPVWVWINLVAALFSVSLYVFFASRLQTMGFPLEDAWIHQTYARNLADLGEWSFMPGMTSAGSTSPLWTFLLAIVNLVSQNTPLILTYLLGAFALWGLACLAELIFRQWINWNKTKIPIAGMMMAAEWHLVWAGASGMETLLMAVVVLAVFYYLGTITLRGSILAGLVIGIGVWVRPDALTLLGPLVFVLVFQKSDWKQSVKTLPYSFSALSFPLGVYLLFNFWLSGHIWPNTFYAKQAEYAALQEIPLLTRYFQILSLPMVGVGVLLLPGFIYKAIQAVRRRNYYWMAGILWWLGYSLVYSLQLPVTYQHGRYLIPAMPVYFLIGLIGSLEWLNIELPAVGLRWAINRVWAGASMIILAVFLIIGGQNFSQDVGLIKP